MGLATIACFERGFDFSSESLRSELAREPAPIRAVVDRFRNEFDATDWTLEGDEIRGPGGFVMRLSPHVIRLRHGREFTYFVENDDHRELMRRAFFQVARMVGSRRAIYMHELLPNGFEDGVTLLQMEGRLRWDFGAPSATFGELVEAEDFGRGCWFIDDFADLREPAGPRSPYR